MEQVLPFPTAQLRQQQQQRPRTTLPPLPPQPHIISDTFLAFTTLIGSQLLTHWTLLDRLSAWVLILIYYAGHGFFTRLGQFALETHAWLLFGHILTFLVVQDILQHLRGTIGSLHGSYVQATLGLFVCLCALPLTRYSLFSGSHIVQTVIYTLALYYSGDIFRQVTRANRPFLNVPVLVILVLSLCWLNCKRYLRPSSRFVGFITQVSIFFLSRWLVYVYRVHTTASSVDCTVSVYTILFLALLIALIGRIYIIDKATERSILETFAYFLTQTLFHAYKLNRHSLTFFVFCGLVSWYLLRSVRNLLKPRLQNYNTYWAEWITYMLGLAMRVSSYVIVQALFPYVSFAVEHTLTTAECAGIYALLVVFASYFLWYDSRARAVKAEKSY